MILVPSERNSDRRRLTAASSGQRSGAAVGPERRGVGAAARRALAQDLAGRDEWNAQRAGDAGALGALPGAGLTQQGEAHGTRGG